MEVRLRKVFNGEIRAFVNASKRNRIGVGGDRRRIYLGKEGGSCQGRAPTGAGEGQLRGRGAGVGRRKSRLTASVRSSKRPGVPRLRPLTILYEAALTCPASR